MIRYPRTVWVRNNNNNYVPKYFKTRDDLNSYLSENGISKYRYTPLIKDPEGEKFKFFLITVNDGSKGCFIISSKKLSIDPKLTETKCQDGNFVKNILDDIQEIVFNEEQPWKHSNVSPKLFEPYKSLFFKLGNIYTRRKLLYINVYAITRNQLDFVIREGEEFSNKNWYKRLYKYSKRRFN